jgi:hypothetical protein
MDCFAMHVYIVFQKSLNARHVQLVIIVIVELLNLKLVLLERSITCRDCQLIAGLCSCLHATSIH